MVANLDATDRKILCELDCDSRRSLSVIGKKVRMSKEAVHYRIKRLEKLKIIKSYPTIISLAKMGKIHMEIFLRLHNTTPALKNDMIKFFVEIRSITYIASCKGNWDLLLGIIVDDITELNSIKNIIFDKYSSYFQDCSLSFTTETYFYGRKYLMGKDINMTSHIDVPGKEEVSDTNKAILRLLSSNARLNPLSIAKQINISAKSVAYRIKKMKRQNIIQKYTLVINANVLNMSVFKLFLNLKNSSHKKRFLEYFHKQPNTINVREVLSNWNLEPTFEVSSTKEFYKIVNQIENLFGKHINSHTSVMIDKEHKVELFPSLDKV